MLRRVVPRIERRRIVVVGRREGGVVALRRRRRVGGDVAIAVEEIAKLEVAAIEAFLELASVRFVGDVLERALLWFGVLVVDDDACRRFDWVVMTAIEESVERRKKRCIGMYSYST